MNIKQHDILASLLEDHEDPDQALAELITEFKRFNRIKARHEAFYRQHGEIDKQRLQDINDLYKQRDQELQRITDTLNRKIEAATKEADQQRDRVKSLVTTGLMRIDSLANYRREQLNEEY